MPGCRRIVVALIAASAGLLVVSASAWANQFTLGNVRSHGYVLSGSGDDVGDPLMLELVRRGTHSVETVTFTVARAKVRDGDGCSQHVRARFGRYGAIALTIRPRSSCTEIAPDTSRRAVATGVLVLAIPGGGLTIRLSRLPARVFNPVAVCACLPPSSPDCARRSATQTTAAPALLPGPSARRSSARSRDGLSERLGPLRH